MATSVPVPMARPRSACASAGASLTPSPTMATTRPSPCRRRIDVGLAGRAGRRRSPRAMPTSRATAAAVAALSPVSSTGRRPSACSSATALALVGLGASATDEQAARRAVPAGRDDGLAAGLRGQQRLLELRRQAHAPLCEQARTAGDDGMALDAPSTPSPARLRNDATRRQLAALAPRRVGDGPRRSGARRRARARPTRRSSSSRLTPRGDDDVAQLHAAAGHGARLVEHDRVDAARRLEHLGSLDEDAELRAAPRADEQRRRRREAERAGAGDDQHGHGGRDREGGARAVGAARTTSVATARPSTTGTKTAETRSARRCTGALPVWASLTSRPICASAVSAPTFVARTTRRPPTLTVRAGDLVAGVLLDRASTRRSAAPRRPPRSPPRRRRRSRTFSPGRTTKRSPTRSSAIGIRRSPPVGVEHRDVLGAELEQRAQRRAGAAPGARLEVAAEQHEGRDDRGHLEVDRVAGGIARGDELERHAQSAAPAPRKQSATTDQPQARQRAERDERVHGRRAMAQVLPGGAVERAGPPTARRAWRARARPTASSRTAAPGSSPAPARAPTGRPRPPAAGAVPRRRRPQSPAPTRAGARRSLQPRPRPPARPASTRPASKRTLARSVA